MNFLNFTIIFLNFTIIEEFQRAPLPETDS